MSIEVITLQYRGRVALITINNEKKLGALTQQNYYDLATKLNEVATHEEVVTTLIAGKGRFFSAGADVSIRREAPANPSDAHKLWLQTFVASNLNITHAFATYPKIIVVALNGPVVGLSAALVGWADFIYCTPHTFLLTPFSSLGLVRACLTIGTGQSQRGTPHEQAYYCGGAEELWIRK